MQCEAQAGHRNKGQPCSDHRAGGEQGLHATMDQPGGNAGDQCSTQHAAERPETGENKGRKAIRVETWLAEIQMKTDGSAGQCAGQRPAEPQQPDRKPILARTAGQFAGNQNVAVPRIA